MTGDTKVVEKGKGDGVFITTTGVGVIPPASLRRRAIGRGRGDVVIVSGTLGDHGVAILSSREGLSFETTIESDSAPLHRLVARMVEAVPDIHVLRDPTRGGLSATLNEIAQQSGVGMLVEEGAIPVREEVKAACELLGLDPLYLANEGQARRNLRTAGTPRGSSTTMRADPLGTDAAIVGKVVDDEHRFVQMETTFGGRRILDWLVGEALPRIC